MVFPGGAADCLSWTLEVMEVMEGGWCDPGGAADCLSCGTSSRFGSMQHYDRRAGGRKERERVEREGEVE